MRVDPLYSLGLTGSLDTLTARENNLSAQLSSGLRVAKAGDDPLAAAASLRLGSAAVADDAYVSAESSLSSRVQVADSALGSAVTQITSAIALAVKAGNGTLNSGDLTAMSQQMAGLRDEVVSLANTSYAGSYLFSGTNATVKPFTTDTTTSPATTTYAGDEGTQYAQTPSGQKIAVSVPGSTLFSASGSDVLGSLNNLVADLANGDQTSTTTDLTTLRAGLENLSTQRGTLDASLNTLQSTATYVSTDAANLRAAQSALVGTDTAAVATELSSTETQNQALLSVISSTDKNDLFNYMNN